jgi:hypothetical protein
LAATPVRLSSAARDNRTSPSGTAFTERLELDGHARLLHGRSAARHR